MTMRLRTTSVLGLVLGTFLVSAETCESTAPPPDTCVTGRTLTIGSPTAGAVAGGDCLLPDAEGRHGDSYTFSLETQSILAFHVTGTTETGVRIRDNGKTGAQQEVALHENGLAEYGSFVTLKPGSYTLDIAAEEDDASGDYTIGTNIITAPNPAGCVQPPAHWRFAMVGTTTEGVINSGDCTASQPQYKSDLYLVKAFSGGGVRKVTLTTSAATTVEIRLLDSPNLVTSPVFTTAAGTVTAQFNPGTTGYYVVGLIGTPGTGTITYSIKFE
jgi:hypothetical protein